MDTNACVGSMDMDMDRYAKVSADKDVDLTCATRTTPVAIKHYKKIMGAKTAKKIELATNSDFTLSAVDATMYRALSARCSYLAKDRPDLAYSS